MRSDSMVRARRSLTMVIMASFLALVFLMVAFTDRSADAQSQDRDRLSNGEGQGKASTPPAAQSTDKKDKPDRGEPSPVVEIDGVKVASGEFVITYKDKEKFKADDEAAKEKDKGAKEIREIPQINARVVEFDNLKKDKADETKAKKVELEKRSDVEAVDYVVLAEPDFIPNDSYAQNGTLDRLLGSHSYGGSEVYAAWDQGNSTGSNAKIAVIDSGIDYYHPDVDAGWASGDWKVKDWFDFYNDNSDAQDQGGHGTHVAGIAAAHYNNSTGVAGVAPNAYLYTYQVVRPDGLFDTAAAADAMSHATDMGVHYVNMSFSAGGPLGTYFDNAVNYAYNQNGVGLWAAAGNNSSGPIEAYRYPCAYYAVNCVGASTPSNTVANFSIRSDEVDVCAPGETIMSAVPNDTYGTKSGTSMATPTVVGLAATLEARNFSRTADDIYYRLISPDTTWDLGSAGWDKGCGYGKPSLYYGINGW